MFAGSSTKFAALIRVDLESSTVTVLRESSKVHLDAGYFSVPSKLKYPTTDGKFAYGNLYLPKVSDNCLFILNRNFIA